MAEGTKAKPAHGKARPRRGARERAASPHPRIAERRARVEDAARSQRRLRWVVLGSVLGILALVVGLALSPLFAVRTVVIHTGPHTPAAAVAAAAELSGRPAMVTLDPGAIAARVDTLAWVASTSVERRWPSTVVLTVVERTPVAVMTGRTGPMLVDASGRVLGPAPQHSGLVRVSVGTPVGAPGSQVPATGGGALAVASSLPPAFKAQVAEVVEQGGQVRLALRSPVTFKLGTTANLLSKYEAIAAVLAHAQLTVGDVVDVSTPSAVVISHG